MKYTEIERKFELPDPEQLIDRLAAIGATAVPPVRQVDTYFNPPHRDFLASPVISEWLRLREQEGKTSVNYKRWLPDGAEVKTHCDEYESVIGDIEAVRRILTALNFSPIVTVDKTRREWHAAGEVTVAVDQVEGVGSYVEFEFEGDCETVEDALAQLGKFVASLGISLGEPLNYGYPHLLLGRQK
ncbi:MAG: class IV adenylate cyclase [Streptosporangiaceae bacterium]